MAFSARASRVPSIPLLRPGALGRTSNIGAQALQEAIAQKQDLSDPEVISQFAQRVGDERRLAALYLLTVADIRGTSPHVWNAWKGKLLEQLFRATRRLLRGDAMPNVHWIEARKLEALKLYRDTEHIDDDGTPPLWAHTEPSYFQRFDAAEIAWHALMLNDDSHPATAVVKVRPQADDDPLQGYAVMVMTRDSPGLFARITGFFEKLGFDIAAAKIYTTAHDYALDAFQILPKSESTGRYRDVIGMLERELARVLDDPAAPLTSHSGRISRQVKHFPMEPAVTLIPARQKPYFELTVSCADRPGLLSAMARVFLAFGVNLHDARITTLGQRAEDVFVLAHPQLVDEEFAREFQQKLTAELRP